MPLCIEGHQGCFGLGTEKRSLGRKRLGEDGGRGRRNIFPMAPQTASLLGFFGRS